MTRKFSFPKLLTASALGLAATGAIVMGFGTSTPPATAQMTVFDPHNYSQNLLTAARTLQQINNQIKSLQNEAQSLLNQAHNLTTINFPELQTLTATIQQIDQLMGQAQGIQFRAANVDQQFRQFFPQSFSQALTTNQQVINARARMDTARSAFQQTMTVQAQVVENVQADTQTLNGIVNRSQGAQGALQAAQATNQLLALTAKQQFQIQNLMAAQYRAEAIEQARRTQSQMDGQAAIARFLGSGNAYTPQ